MRQNALLPLPHNDSAGYDLFLPYNCDFFPNHTVKINTGLRFNIPLNYYGKIFDKSSISTAYNLIVLGGVIDCDYNGDIYVCLRNIGDKIVSLPKGCAIAQIIFMPYTKVKFNVVTRFCKTSKRGYNGFGSTTPQCISKKIKVYDDVKDYVEIQKGLISVNDESDDEIEILTQKFTPDEDLGDYDLDKYEKEKRGEDSD